MADRFTVVVAIRDPKGEGSSRGASPSVPEPQGAGKCAKSGNAQTKA